MHNKIKNSEVIRKIYKLVILSNFYPIKDFLCISHLIIKVILIQSINILS